MLTFILPIFKRNATVINMDIRYFKFHDIVCTRHRALERSIGFSKICYSTLFNFSVNLSGSIPGKIEIRYWLNFS